MKKILFAAFLILFTFLLSKPVEASHGVDIDISSSDGQNWTIVVGNSQNHATAGTTRTLTFGAFWCNQNGDGGCDDNSLDYRGLKTIDSNLVITVPTQGSANTYTRQFGINTRSGYACGTVQGDVTQSSGTTGGLWWSGSNCATTATLTQPTTACSLKAEWDLGFNDNANCQIKIEAGGTLYQLNNTDCEGSTDLSGNISTPQGNLSFHNGGIYKLHAGHSSSDLKTLNCPAATTPTSTPPPGDPLFVTCSVNKSTAAINEPVTWTAIPQGGTTDYTSFSWSQSTEPLNSRTGATVNVTYPTTGTKTGRVTVTDSAGNTATSTNTCQVTINTAGGSSINSISTPNPVTRIDSTSSWTWSPSPTSPFFSVGITKTPTGNVFYKKASGINPGLCSGTLCQGWTPVLSDVSSGNHPWTPSTSLSDGVYTFGLFTSSNNEILAVSETNFITGSPTATPTSGPPGCSLKLNGSSTGTLNTSTGSTILIESVNPSTPYRITLDGDGVSPNFPGYGPYNSPSGSATWYTSGWDGGAYTVSNGCASRTVNLSLSCSTSGSFTLNVQTFQETNYNPEQWGQKIWKPSDSGLISACREDEGNNEGVSAYRPPEPTLKDKIFRFFKQVLPIKITFNLPGITVYAGSIPLGGVCNETFECDTSDPGIKPCEQVYCGIPPASIADRTCRTRLAETGTLCGTNAVGQNLYCRTNLQTDGRLINGDGQSRHGILNSICILRYCKTNSECEDNNACTNDICTGYVHVQAHQETNCSADDEGREICDTVDVPESEQMGTCSLINNNAPTTVCQTDNSTPPKPLKLCSPVGNEIADPTCSVDYVQCTDVRNGGGTTNACCGLTNIQGNQCYGYCKDARFPTSWNNDSALPFNGPPNDFPTQPLGGVVVRIEDTRDCGINHVVTTDANGMATVNLPRIFQDRRIRYRVTAVRPEGMKFTRGVFATDKGRWNEKPGYEASYPDSRANIDPYFDYVSGGIEGTSKRVTFGFERSIPLNNNPWIQTTGGNVHSQDRIKSESGPEFQE